MTAKVNKSERQSYITKTLIDYPSKIFTLQYFSDIFDCAKSTLSEDIDALSKMFKSMELGEIQSVSGAAGGIFYQPTCTKQQIMKTQDDLCKLLSDPKRIIAGGYLYTNDIFYNPKILTQIAQCMLTKYAHVTIDYVATIETKGIPLATILGGMMNKPVIVVRKSARLTEGPTISMNYVSGSSKNIHTMALPIKAIDRNSKVLFVDDFMKGGGTAKGVIDLMKAYDIEVVGVAVVMVTEKPEKKTINQFYSLIELVEIDESQGNVKIIPKMGIL